MSLTSAKPPSMSSCLDRSQLTWPVRRGDPAADADANIAIDVRMITLKLRSGTVVS